MDTAELRGDLTESQEAFCVEYVYCANATRAYRTAYNPSDPRAAWIGNEAWKLLQKPEVRARVLELREWRKEFIGVDSAWVIEVLTENIGRAMQEHPVTGPDGKPTGEFKYDGAVVNKAAELIGKHIGMWTEKIEHSGGVTYVPFAFDPNEAAQHSADDWEGENR